MIDHPLLSLPLFGYAPIPRGGKLGQNGFNGLSQVLIIILNRLIVITAASPSQRLTDLLDRILWSSHVNHLPFPLQTELNSGVAFFKISISIVNRPTIRSNSAIRS